MQWEVDIVNKHTSKSNYVINPHQQSTINKSLTQRSTYNVSGFVRGQELIEQGVNITPNNDTCRYRY